MEDDVEGLVRVSDGLAILSAIDAFFSRPSAVAESFRWSDFGSPVVDRGDTAIYPLALAETAEGTESEAVQALAGLADELARHCVHFHGGDFFHAENEVDLDDGFGRNLLASGAIVTRSSLNWWGVRNQAAVLVRSLDRERSVERLALHILPREWLSELPVNAGTKREASRRRRIAKQRAASDVTWSWPLPDAEG